MPLTRLRAGLAQVLKDEGFILEYQVGRLDADESGHKSFQADAKAVGPGAVLRVFLKYGPEGERVIRHIGRVSKPGRRIYKRSTELRPVLDGLGIAVLSTSRGIMSDRQARSQRVGGEVLCTVW
jgi:small subunit ribosomal protein S8